MKTNLTSHEIGKVFRSAVAGGFIRQEDTAVIFQDMTFLEERIVSLKSFFPLTTLHAIAIKANPLIRILQRISPLRTGIEAATIGEINIALESGYEPGRIVYDSPVKTVSEIGYALEKGIHLNIDNLSELERVKQTLSRISFKGTIGIRINPQVGTGTIAESSVAGEYSKFGVPIRYRRKELTDAFLTCPWLTGMHLHVGSQGCSMELLLSGIGVLYDFMLEINEKRNSAGMPPVSVFDTGGGFPVSYNRQQEPPSMEEYARLIRERYPVLFSGKISLITEFGRWVYANTGWVASRVEYVKEDPGVKTAMLHVGADLFVRECLNPKDWQHEYTVLDSKGNCKTGVDSRPYNLAGPLCFSGDIIAKNVALPAIGEGDCLIIHDAGGYTFSMWSRYNSRQTPRILGYSGDGDHFTVLKERETIEDLFRSWR